MSDPSDQRVREAVGATGDIELSALTAADGSFVLRPARVQGERVALYHVVLVNVSHPMSVMLAVMRDTGAAVVTSGRPEAVADIVEADAGLREAETVWDLIRDPPADGQLLDATLAAPDKYEFEVREPDTGLVRCWRLSLAGSRSRLEQAG